MSADMRSQLDKARKLIENKQYDAARDVLRHMGDHPTAHKWLKRLDEIDPPFPGDTTYTDFAASANDAQQRAKEKLKSYQLTDEEQRMVKRIARKEIMRRNITLFFLTLLLASVVSHNLLPLVSGMIERSPTQWYTYLIDQWSDLITGLLALGALAFLYWALRRNQKLAKMSAHEGEA